MKIVIISGAVIVGFLLLFLWSCMRVSSICSREEELREFKSKLNEKKD